MGCYNDVREIVGNTPILKLNRIGKIGDVSIFAKLEYLNPGGSMKDRIGIQILKEAEESGQLKPGGTIIEATAGNTGIGLALAAVDRGYKLKLLVSEKFSIEKRSLMEALGAELIITPAEEGIDGSMARAEEMAKNDPGVFVAHQFENEANTHAHYATGEEIWQDMDGHVDVVVAGAGSGGSFTGISKRLKEHDPKIKAVLADPIGSILGGGDPGVYKVEGIGNHFIPKIFDPDFPDEVEKISDDDSYFMVRIMTAYEGVIGGSSSGTAFAAAVKQAYKMQGQGEKNIVAVFPDRADRYFSENVYRTEKSLTDFKLSDVIEKYAKDIKVL